MPAHILVVGAGAIGSFFGARLASIAAVSALCRSNYPVVKAHGLKITSPKFGEAVWKPDLVFASADEVRGTSIKWDYLLVTTKALPDVQDDSSMLEGLVGPHTSIVVLQNGLGVEQPYYSRFPSTTILSAVTIASVAQPFPGHIKHNRWTRIHVGPYLPHSATATTGSRGADDLANERASKLVDLLVAAGIRDTGLLDHANLQFIRWHKVAINAAMNPTSVLSGGADNKTMSTDPELARHLIGIMNEVLETAPKVLCRPLPSNLPTPEAVIESTAKESGGSRPSMLADWEQGRNMELEVILGNPIRLARDIGVEMPRLQAMYALLKKAQDLRRKSSSKL